MILPGQLGSSVATSLAKGESEEKFVGLLKVCKGEYKLKKLKLKTVRPFVFQDMILKEFEDEMVVKGKKEKSEVVEEFVDHYIENVLIAEAAKQFTGSKLFCFYKQNKNSLKISKIEFIFKVIQINLKHL